VITLLNEKGGVGKTTLATHIAAGMAIKGQRVVLIDADPQANATIAFGHAEEPGLYDLLVRNASFKDTLRFVSPELYEKPGEQVAGQMFLIPSNIETRSIANNIADPFLILRRLQEIREAIDLVVFDTSPTPSLLHGSIYISTDAIIYPTKCESLSFRGLINSFEHRDNSTPYRLKSGLNEIVTLGIVPTMFRGSTLEHQENLQELQNEYGSAVWSPVSLSTIWAEAARVQRMVWNTAPGTKAALEGWQLADHTETALINV
jgi:chromosome partitioning protein